MGILTKLFPFISCPYQDKDCPKISELKASDKGQDDRIDSIIKILYVIIGMIAVNWGVAIW